LACAAESEGFRRKTNRRNPEPEGSGQKHRPALQPTRLLGDSIILQKSTKPKLTTKF